MCHFFHVYHASFHLVYMCSFFLKLRLGNFVGMLLYMSASGPELT